MENYIIFNLGKTIWACLDLVFSRLLVFFSHQNFSGPPEVTFELKKFEYFKLDDGECKFVKCWEFLGGKKVSTHLAKLTKMLPEREESCWADGGGLGRKKQKSLLYVLTEKSNKRTKPILPIFISNPEEAQRVSPHTHFGTRLNVRQLRCVISHSKLVVRATFNPAKHKEKKQSANNSSARSHRIDKFKICLGRISHLFAAIFLLCSPWLLLVQHERIFQQQPQWRIFSSGKFPRKTNKKLFSFSLSLFMFQLHFFYFHIFLIVDAASVAYFFVAPGPGACVGTTRRMRHDWEHTVKHREPVGKKSKCLVQLLRVQLFFFSAVPTFTTDWMLFWGHTRHKRVRANGEVGWMGK